jgi:hypothetical protein
MNESGGLSGRLQAARMGTILIVDSARRMSRRTALTGSLRMAPITQAHLQATAMEVMAATMAVATGIATTATTRVMRSHPSLPVMYSWERLVESRLVLLVGP